MKKVILIAAVPMMAGMVFAGCGTCGGGSCATKKAACSGDKAECTTQEMTCHKAPASGVVVLNTEELKKALATETGVVVLDARSGKYDDGRRIPGAKALSPKATAEEAAALIPTKETAVITYCANLKCPASGMLAEHLKELGYVNIREFPEGIEGWVAAGNPVETK